MVPVDLCDGQFTKTVATPEFGHVLLEGGQEMDIAALPEEVDVAQKRVRRPWTTDRRLCTKIARSSVSDSAVHESPRTPDCASSFNRCSPERRSDRGRWRAPARRPRAKRRAV